MTQKWAHKLDPFESLSLKEQEDIVGRTKEDSVELEEKEKQILMSLVLTFTKDGKGLKIWEEVIRSAVHQKMDYYT